MEATPDSHGREPRSRDGPRAAGARWRRVASQVPTAAVILVVFTAVITTLVLTRHPPQREERSATPVAAPAKAAPAVVTAPPLAAQPAAGDSATAGVVRQGTGRVACSDCGVVESVVALGQVRDAPAAYQMRIRMDDGSVRTVEQRGALAAGSRVVVAGGLVRPAGQPG